jgi:exonuclease SbcD
MTPDHLPWQHRGRLISVRKKEDKGFIMIQLERGSAQWNSVPQSELLHYRVDLSSATEPQAVLQKQLRKNIQNAVVRLIYKLRSEQLDQIDSALLHRALSAAHSYTIQPELVSQLARPRLPELQANSSIDPMQALKTYLDNREDLKDIALNAGGSTQVTQMSLKCGSTDLALRINRR